MFAVWLLPMPQSLGSKRVTLRFRLKVKFSTEPGTRGSLIMHLPPRVPCLSHFKGQGNKDLPHLCPLPPHPFLFLTPPPPTTEPTWHRPQVSAADFVVIRVLLVLNNGNRVSCASPDRRARHDCKV